MKCDFVLVATQDSQVRRLAEEAVKLGFPEARLSYANGLDEALTLNPQGELGLLVLANAASGDTARASRAMDAAGLPRWAVAVVGPSNAHQGLEVIPGSAVDAADVARHFRASLQCHSLARSNERLSGDLKTIARRVTHDLRTPLGCIRSVGEALREILSQAMPTDSPLADSLLESADELSNLIDRVGFLVRATADPPPFQPISMGEPVFNVLQRLEGKLRRANVAVESATDWPVVTAVGSWLEVIWWNFVSNALRHGQGLSRVSLGWTREGNRYRFWLGDNGRVVAEKTRVNLFQPFHRLHLLTSARGLGLSIVQRLVTLQGGTCGYDTPPPGGHDTNVFYFTLPIPIGNKD